MMSKLILSISAFFLLKSINASIGCQYQLQNIFFAINNNCLQKLTKWYWNQKSSQLLSVLTVSCKIIKITKSVKDKKTSEWF